MPPLSCEDLLTRPPTRHTVMFAAEIVTSLAAHSPVRESISNSFPLVLKAPPLRHQKIRKLYRSTARAHAVPAVYNLSS